jgi:16S rRNA (cytidine1402-2'-O)-methyltransferase
MAGDPPSRAGEGTLYVVGTPIGNLGDITLRALETLRAVSDVAAEDTRRTRALLTHFGISGKRLHAIDAHATVREIEKLTLRLRDGHDVALVTDAGMPTVSDPGAALVRAAAAQNLRVLVLPGPSAVTAAAALSGLVEASFWFVGFLARRGAKRERLLERIAAFPDPVILFEAPNRVADTVTELAAILPDRPASISREISKLHEETLRGSLAELAARAAADGVRGEVTIVLGPSPSGVSERLDDADLDARIEERLGRGVPTKAIAAELAALSGRPRREVYARVEAFRHRRREE